MNKISDLSFGLPMVTVGQVQSDLQVNRWVPVNFSFRTLHCSPILRASSIIIRVGMMIENSCCLTDLPNSPVFTPRTARRSHHKNVDQENPCGTVWEFQSLGMSTNLDVKWLEFAWNSTKYVHYRGGINFIIIQRTIRYA